MRIFLLLLILLGCLPDAESGLQEAAGDGSTIEGMNTFRGSKLARRMLLDQGFVVTDETYRQICSFYIHRSPSFITTDSVLYAYFVNVERGVKELEEKQATRLQGFVEKLVKGLQEFRTKRFDPLLSEGKIDKTWGKALDNLGDYLRVAHALTTGATSDEDLKRHPERIAQELRLILEGARRTSSPLRGVPLDYSRFKPQGLYEGKSELERFCRASAWLHEVPFRTASEDETRQAALLNEVIRETRLGYDLPEFLRPYRSVLGPSDDLSSEDYSSILSQGFPSTTAMAGKPEEWARAWKAIRELPKPRINTIPTAGAAKDPSLFHGLRLLPRPALFENHIFAAITPSGLDRPPVSGEEFMAVLGSPAAVDIVKSREGTQIPGYDALFKAAQRAGTEAEKSFESVLLISQRALYRTLLDPPGDETLPPYVRHPAWRYKDLNTCLAGWAHHRMIWDLHGKRNVGYAGDAELLPGIVEPNPAFFDALLDLTLRTEDFFRNLNVTDTRFHNLSVLLLDLRSILKGQLAGRAMTDREKNTLKDYGPSLGYVCGLDGNSWLSDDRLPDTSFSVPLSLDLFRGVERVVGQARPRAIYVVIEDKGKKYLTVGGVLSYRDFVGPDQGLNRMTPGRWREKAANEDLPEPPWQARFSVSYGKEEFLALLETGRILDQMFPRAGQEMGEILARKIAAGDKFTYIGEHAACDHAVRLFGHTNHPRLLETLLPLLHKPRLVGIPQIHEGWPEAAALKGKLGSEHAGLFIKWIQEGHPYPHLLLGLAATIPGDESANLVLKEMDRIQEDRKEAIGEAARNLLAHPGLRISRELFNRLKTYSLLHNIGEPF
jgi:hypothetical protein